jgi:hypothetical protein
MAGYAATARITHVAPHRAVHREPVDTTVADLVELDVPAVEEVSGQPYLATLSDAWDDVREIWRQSMDVLRDPRIY